MPSSLHSSWRRTPRLPADAPHLDAKRRRYRRATQPLLVLDDLGTDAADPSSAVTEVIFKRHAEDRAMWITTWMNSAASRTPLLRPGRSLRLPGARIVERLAIGASRTSSLYPSPAHSP